MTIPAIVTELVQRFERNRDAYRSGQYNETQVRRKKVKRNPMCNSFCADGWNYRLIPKVRSKRTKNAYLLLNVVLMKLFLTCFNRFGVAAGRFNAPLEGKQTYVELHIG